MRGLFTKIFLGFWIAQSLTFVITTLLIVQHHFVRPNEMMQVLEVTMPILGARAADAYEAGGCAGFTSWAASLRYAIYLSNSPGKFICQTTAPPALIEALGRTPMNADSSPHLLAPPSGEGDNLWTARVHSGAGRPYILLLSQNRIPEHHWLRDLSHFAFPQLWVAVVVCGATTFVLVLLLTRPIAKLRAAARQLAKGELSARVPNFGGEGRLLGGDEIQGLVHDFNHMAERLEHLVGAQKILLRDVSHELRSPLARLSVALELAREESPVAMQLHLERIERETGRLNELIGQLLRLSSMESMDTETVTESFSLPALLEDLLPDAEFEARQRSCTIEVVRECECTVQGRPELIYRAVENIVRNAVRYTAENSSVDLSIRCVEEGGGNQVILEVSDRGPGLPEDELDSIFRPFYRVDDARSSNTGGFGVGLAIAERAVRLHHGELRAQNRPGGGLVVSLRLPCQLIPVHLS